MTSAIDGTRIASLQDADARAREVEAQLTDDERLSLVISETSAVSATSRMVVPANPRSRKDA
jgi:hypothetical protein